MSTLIRGGQIVDPIDGQYAADLLIDGDRIVSIHPAKGPEPVEGPTSDAEGPEPVEGPTPDGKGPEPVEGPDQIIDATGLLIMPGAIDAHSHADARVFDDDVQHALLRSGVTTVITGQDGVSYAPGDGQYATDYFGALNGVHPTYTGGGVGALLDGYRGATRLNVGYLVPAGTVRYEVMGRTDRRPTDDELQAMISLVEQGIAEGALGLSTGLDYVPGCFADANELAALCRPLAEHGGLYVSHIRGYEENSAVGIAELIEICRTAGVPGHVSHFHARPELIKELIDQANTAGVDLSWDAYPYFRGFTLLSMVLLPVELIKLGNERAAAVLADEANWSQLQAEFADRVDTDTNLGAGWRDRVRIADAGHRDHAELEGLTLAEAGRRRDCDPLAMGYRILADSGLKATTVMAIPQPRTDDHLARQFALPGACSGSDGIFHGGAPHPRAYGCVARMYSLFGRERQDFDWPHLTAITAGTPAVRFRLADRGRVTAGAIADLVLLDPERIRDVADYDRPTQLSEGIDRVLVGGRSVLVDGELTDGLAGGPVRPTA